MSFDTHNKCQYCAKELPQGVNVIKIQQGVLGPKGYVALEDGELFCDERCLRDFYGNNELTRGAERIA